MRVLVADDDPEMRGWLLRALAFQGHVAEAVGDGDELIRRAAAFDADVVLSDIGLPGCDGISAGLRLRKNRPGRAVILMTGDRARAAEARRAGFPAVLDKPFALGELSAALSSF